MERYCPVCDVPDTIRVNGYVSTSSKFCGEHGVKIEERLVAGHWKIKEYEENLINGDKHLCLDYHTGEWNSPDSHSDTIPVYELIFNHDFAESLWGDGESCSCGGVEQISLIIIHDENCKISNNWKQHLRQMAIADSAIEYLGKNI
jgi:hypothetical protein